MFPDLELLQNLAFFLVGNTLNCAGGETDSRTAYLWESTWTHSEKRTAASVALRA